MKTPTTAKPASTPAMLKPVLDVLSTTIAKVDARTETHANLRRAYAVYLSTANAMPLAYVSPADDATLADVEARLGLTNSFFGRAKGKSR